MPPRKVMLPAALTLALMVTMRFVSFAPAEATDAPAYHDRVRAAAFAIPSQVGDWEGRDIDIPAAAITLLKPNVLIGRAYVDEKTQRGFSLLLVQCGDARDMEGHFPPKCYPGNGWELKSDEPFDLSVTGEPVNGRTYRFERSLRGLPEELTVMNIILLPNGTFGDGMREVRRLAGSYRERFYGAGQLQLVFGGGWSDAERLALADEFLAVLRPVMDTVMRKGQAGPVESASEAPANVTP